MQIHCPACRCAYDFPVELLRDAPFIGRCAACDGPIRLSPDGVVAGVARAGTAPEEANPGASPESDTPRVPTVPPGLSEEPTAVRIARIEVQRAAVEAAVDTGAESAEAEAGDYLIVRGEVRGPPEARRRVVFTSSPQAGERRTARPSRVIAHSARFGRSGKEPTASPAVEARTSPVPAALPPRSGPGRRTLLLFGLAFVAAALGLAIAVNLVLRGLDGLQTRDEGVRGVAVVDAEPPLGTAPPSSPPRLVQLLAPAAAGPLDPEARRIEVRVDAIKTYPGLGVVAVFGTLSNLSNQSWGEIQLEARLLAGRLPIRRRDVWCCDEIAPEAVEAVATEPGHRHFQSARDLGTLTELPLDEDRAFTIVFPALGAQLAAHPAAAAPFSAPFSAQINLVRALTVTARP